jgi:polysaccharide export outer membrane protein
MNFQIPLTRERSCLIVRYLILAGLVQIGATAVGQAQQAPATKEPTFATREPRYHIGLGDIIDVEFPLVPEFNQTVTVQPDGFIQMKTAGDIHVQGLTSPQMVEAIRAAYKDILHDPVIAITLKDFEKPYFTALGKVNKPGKYDLRGDITLTQAIAIAGGLDDAAKHSQVLLFRHADNDADRIEIKAIDVKAMLAGHNLNEDIHLRAGDTIMVPKNMLSKLRPWLPSSSMGMFMNGL